MKQEKKQQLKFNSNTRLAYIGFLFQTFFKRPFGYIVAVLYLVYLALILLIVPSILHLQPLFIWSNAAFNMPIFNLFFIAASAGSLAVTIFRTGREDGTELTLSAKPITKRTMVWGKTIVYLIIMFGFCILTLAIAALVRPIFGEFDLLTNITGVTTEKYVALMFSMLIGNVVSMLFFGGLAVLISMVGGQVITIVGSIGIAFIMVLLNMIFPIAISSPRDVLTNRYNTSINSYSANTLNQFNNPNVKETKPKTFAAIQCITEADGTEVSHFDTNEYWLKANRESGLSITNYVDFGKQLSYIYSSFGLDESKLTEASKLMIGANVSHQYKIDKTTHITLPENLNNKDYPIGIYSLNAKQGVSYPTITILGGDMGLDTDNWYAISTLTQADFDAVVIPSRESNYISSNLLFRANYTHKWQRLCDVVLNEKQYKVSQEMFNTLLYDPNYCLYLDSYTEDATNVHSPAYLIQNDTSDAFFEAGKYDSLSLTEKLFITNKLAISWMVFAQDWQINRINEFIQANNIDDAFPFKSSTVKNWYESTVETPKSVPVITENYFQQKQIENMSKNGLFSSWVDKSQTTKSYSKPITSYIEYCETYNNLYQYKVTSFYNVYALIAIWSTISVGLFTTSIIVYRKTDFK